MYTYYMEATKNTQTTQASAAFQIVAAVAEAVRELGTVPPGVLYANLMGKLDLAGFEKIVGILKGAQLVSESGHQLTWIGPAK
jgi:hypothetical protein